MLVRLQNIIFDITALKYAVLNEDRIDIQLHYSSFKKSIEYETNELAESEFIGILEKIENDK